MVQFDRREIWKVLNVFLQGSLTSVPVKINDAFDSGFVSVKEIKFLV
jgi:hypothetical protein